MWKKLRYKNEEFDEYLINSDTAEIIDIFGNKQDISFYGKRKCFNHLNCKKVYLYHLLMHTFIGYKEGFVIHHIDFNSLNDTLSNLIYVTPEQHSKIHSHSEEFQQIMKDNTFSLGKKHSEEAKERHRKAFTGCKWFNDGKRNYFCKECPEGCTEGMIINQQSKEERIAKLIGRKWYNDGIVEVFTYECPDGWEQGRLKRSK